mmetsp:Transcript_67360/g.140348  ORF Transcript_67360/g.140348 Transcript_67360/m.140348 type:complete len:242 (+) Transcript_67360:666-1391(+)
MPQQLHFLERARERLRQALVLLRNLEHEFLVRCFLLLHLRNLLLQRLDQVQIVVRDVVVVVFDLSKRLLMLLHQLVDVEILPLLHLVDLQLPPTVKLVAQRFHLLVILVLQLLCLLFEVCPQVRNLLVMALLQTSYELLMCKLELLLLQFQIPLVILQLLFAHPVLILQELRGHLEVCLQLRNAVLVLVQEMLDLLLVNLDFYLVPFLHLLHLSVLVPEFSFLLLQLLLRDLPERVDLVSL